MQKRIFLVASLLLMAFSQTSCEKDDDKPSVLQKGTRNLGIHPTEAHNGNFEESFLIAKDAGMDCMPQVVYWRDLESGSTYDPQHLLDIMDVFYPAYNMPVSLCISPIAAVNRGVPEDLTDVSFDDDVMIDRFNELLDYVHQHISHVDLRYLIVGNEVDLYLSNHPEEWEAYKNFFNRVRLHAKALWGDDLMVGSEVTLSSATGLNKANVLRLNQNSDMVCFTYYPLNSDFTMQSASVVNADIKGIMDLYPNRKMFLEECGYATSAVCNSSEQAQADFISSMFDVWDEYHDRLVYVGFLWLHDLSEEQAQNYVVQYGMAGAANEEAFKEYLRTTGMRTYDNTDKKGFVELKEQASERGW